MLLTQTCKLLVTGVVLNALACQTESPMGFDRASTSEVSEEIVFADGFESGLGQHWIDISTSTINPAVVTTPDAPRGSKVLQCEAVGANVLELDCGAEVIGLNGAASSKWRLRFFARDLTGGGGGGWLVGAGQGSYPAPGCCWVEFGGGRGPSPGSNFRFHYNQIGTGFEPYFETNVARDDGLFYHFEIYSDGSDLHFRIDHQAVGVLPGLAFPATRIVVGVAHPTGKVQVDDIRFHVMPGH